MVKRENCPTKMFASALFFERLDRMLIVYLESGRLPAAVQRIMYLLHICNIQILTIKIEINISILYLMHVWPFAYF